ncbi:MAG TPA: hypothetical protein VFN57_18040, partial [Thermomicrobiaceae bacterium]|nr:hypothetical protein [Thermomicrobiaceae bacterium]
MMDNKLNRRDLVKRGAVLGLATPAIAGLLAACGGGSTAPTPGSGGSNAASGTSTSTPTSASSSTATSSSSTATSTSTTSAAGQPKTGGTLTVAIASDIIGNDPHGATSGVDRSVYTTMYNGLVAPNDTLDIVPDLAVKWELTDPKTYVFTLRTGVKFHD